MKAPTLRFVFDRKRVATKTRKGLVQIEVCSERRRKWIGTGVKVYADQWDDRYKVVRSVDMMELNERLDAQMRGLQEFVNGLLRGGQAFDFGKLERHLSEASRPESFIGYVRARIEGRADIAETTRGSHRSMLRTLEAFGRIVNMDDLTRANIEEFDRFLHARGYCQVTVAGYHKNLRSYVNDALAEGRISEYPYAGFRVDKGRSAKRRYLTEAEMRRMAGCAIASPMVARVRDLFMFQCYTGLAYADLARFDFARDAEDRGGRLVVADRRKKTGGDYFIVLMRPAVEILARYGYRLPVISNQKYNAYLKVAAQFAGIDRPLTTHCARHTFAVFALNHGVPIEVVSRMLGHSDVRTTQIYAKIVAESVSRGFDTIERALDGGGEGPRPEPGDGR